MGTLVLSDGELRERLPELVGRERGAIADVIEHLVEFDERRLYLPEACASLFAYCTERLGYSSDEAMKRVRVARLARSFPETLEELRAGRIHLTGLFLLSQHANEGNITELLEGARGTSRREIEEMLARRFPRPKAPARIRTVGLEDSPRPDAPTTNCSEALGSDSYVQNRTCLGPGNAHAEAQLTLVNQTLNYRVEFTAGSELRKKIDRARELFSHAIPDGDLATLFERALDELIRRETKCRLGAEQPRKRRSLKPDSRHIPVEISRQVHERDGDQCDDHGRRCTERRFLTIEHRVPFALGGGPTLENLCLLCEAHNQFTAEQVFGAEHIEGKRRQHRKALPSTVAEKALLALRKLGFAEQEARHAINKLESSEQATDVAALLRAALELLTVSVVKVARASPGEQELRSRSSV